MAVRSAEGVWIGGDSAAVGGLNLTIRRDPKVGRVGPCAIGFTTSFRMGQLLLHSLDVPEPPARKGELYRWMVNAFVDAVRACLQQGGFARKEHDVEAAGRFIVVVNGEIFTVESDYQVAVADVPYAAIGCGENYALGALRVLTRRPNYSALAVCRDALAVAESFSAGVRGPFKVFRAP
ncbi:hypothetical protein [Neoroseomonas terrae]|uniref:hypothetical protein n=1 Tax=Neoroseomonas terrae TaxID=424799 RepID=UPI0030B9E814